MSQNKNDLSNLIIGNFQKYLSCGLNNEEIISWALVTKTEGKNKLYLKAQRKNWTTNEFHAIATKKPKCRGIFFEWDKKRKKAFPNDTSRNSMQFQNCLAINRIAHNVYFNFFFIYLNVFSAFWTISMFFFCIINFRKIKRNSQIHQN